MISGVGQVQAPSMARAMIFSVVIVVLMASCSSPQASPSPSTMPSPSPAPSPAPTQGTPSSAGPVTLPVPMLAYIGQRNYRDNSGRLTAYELGVTNWSSFPSSIFGVGETAPCLRILDAASGEELAGTCPLAAPAELAQLSFSLPRRQDPPPTVYAELVDRRAGVIYRSHSVSIEALAETTPSPRPLMTPGADGWAGPQHVSTRPYSGLTMVVDGSGVVHAAAVLGDGVFYVTNSSGSWTRERLSRAPSGGADLGPRIALDTDSSVWVAFTRWTRHELCIDLCEETPVIRNDGIYQVHAGSAGWSQPERILPAAELTSFAASGGSLHLTLRPLSDVSNGGEYLGLQYATNQAGSWRTVAITGMGDGPTLRLASDGTPRVTFVEGGVLRFAAGSGGTFNVTTVADGWEQAQLTLSDDDSAVIVATSYEGDLSSRLVAFKQNRDGSWSGPQQIAYHEVDGSDEGEWISVALEAVASNGHGAVHVVYRVLYEEIDREEDVSELRDDVWYAGETAGNYTTRLLRSGLGDDFGVSGSESTLALDGTGRPHVLLSVVDKSTSGRVVTYTIGPAQ